MRMLSLGAGGWRSTMPALGVFAVLVTWSASAEACPANPYLGSVCMAAAHFCPRGYAEMEGQIVAISDNTGLFSLLGCQWGGDCRTTFALPDMRGRAAVGPGQGPGLSELNLGQWRGQEEVKIGIHQMPSHTHAAQAQAVTDVQVLMSDSSGASPTPSATNDTLHAVAENAFSVNNKANIYGPEAGASIAMGGVGASTQVTVSLGSTGGSGSVNIRNPVMSVTYCIATTGLFPPRN